MSQLTKNKSLRRNDSARHSKRLFVSRAKYRQNSREWVRLAASGKEIAVRGEDGKIAFVIGMPQPSHAQTAKRRRVLAGLRKRAESVSSKSSSDSKLSSAG
jgi:hypothetical protein